MPEDDGSKHYHHGDLRKALISAGHEIVNQEGFAGLDLRKVARKAGVSHAAPYRHFEDKEALLAAICVEGFLRLNTRLEVLRDRPTDDLAGTLTTFISLYATFALDNSALVREMLSGLFVNYQRYPEMVAVMQVAPQLLAGLLPVGLSAYASILMYAINGLTLQQLKQPDRDTEFLHSEITRLVEVFCRGLPSLF